MYMATLERGKTGGIGYVYGKFRKFCDDVPHVKSDSIESSGMQLAVGGGGGGGRSPQLCFENRRKVP